MKEISHFIGGRHVAGTSGRFGDVFNPATGEVQSRVPFASREEVARAVADAQRAFPAWAGLNPQRRARVMFTFKTLIEKNFDKLAERLSSEHGKVIADSKGDIQRGLEVIEFACGIPASDEGRVHARRGARHRRLFAAPAFGCGRGHHAVQFPRDDPDVDVRHRGRLRQLLHPEAERESAGRASAPRRIAARGGRARGRAPGRQRRQGDGGCDPRTSRHPGGQLCRARRLSRNMSMRRAPRRESACRRWAAPRTTPL